MSKLSLTKIGFYNPRRLTDEEIEASYIARRALFQLIFEKIINHTQEVIPQHQIIIGQRGMGKTLLLYRLGVELRKAPHNKNFIPLNYPEEQYNIDRLSKFWQNSLTALIDALDKENKKELADQLENELDKLNADTLCNASDMYQHFQNWINKIKRCPVLLVDNLNLIFNNISTEDQHKLRANLMTKGAPVLIGASAVVIQDTIDYGAPFYDAFQIQYLKKISLEESIDILQNLSRLTNKKNKIAGILTKYKGRIATIHQLTGGTPRTLSMLFPLIKDGFQDDIQNDLYAIMDMVTPLYKARFEELSTQMQIVLDAIALHWDPASIEQLRKTTQLTNAQLSPQLKRLVDVGWISKLKSDKNIKGSLYEISERFFNVWYLMRRSNRRQQKELHCLSQFLEMFYGEDLMQIAALRLKKTTATEEGAFINLAIARVVKDEKLSKELSDKSYEKLIEEAKKDSGILSRYSIPKGKLANELRKLSSKLINSYKKNNIADFIRIANEVIQLTKKYDTYELALDELIKMMLLYSTKLRELELYEESEELLNQILELCSDLNEEKNQKYFDKIWFEFGKVYAITKRFKEAIESFLKVKSTKMKNSDYWLNLGASYQDDLQFKSAKEAYLKSIKLNPNVFVVYQLLGDLCFYNLLDYKTAEEAYLSALKLKSHNIKIWFELGLLYRKTNKPIEAKNVYKEIFKIGSETELVFFSLALLYLIDLHQPKNSIEAHIDFIKSAPEKVKLGDRTILISRYNLFFLYMSYSKDINKAKEQFDLVSMNNPLKAQLFLCKAILSYADQNAGIAKDHIILATKQGFSTNYRYHWYMAGVTIKNLNFGEHYVEVLKKTGFDKIWKPYYVAMKALLAKEPKLYLNTVAEEVRKPAAEILDWMQKFDTYPQSSR